MSEEPFFNDFMEERMHVSLTSAIQSYHDVTKCVSHQSRIWCAFRRRRQQQQLQSTHLQLSCYWSSYQLRGRSVYQFVELRVLPCSQPLNRHRRRWQSPSSRRPDTVISSNMSSRGIASGATGAEETSGSSGGNDELLLSPLISRREADLNEHEREHGTPTSASAGINGPPSQATHVLNVIPTPERDSLAGMKSRKEDPSYLGEENVDGTARTMYQPIPPISVNVPLDDVSALISVSETGPLFTPIAKADQRRSKDFRAWFDKKVPPHFGFAFLGDIEHTFPPPKKGRGRPRKAKFLIGLHGLCSAHVNGCNTTFSCGLTEATVRSMLDGSVEDEVEVTLIIEGRCSHEKNKSYGQNRGHARTEMLKDYLDTGIQPSQYAKKSIDTSTDSEIQSNNRAHVLSKRNAGNVSRESKALSLKALGLTKCKLTNIMIMNRLIVEDDLKQRAKLNDPKTDLTGIVRQLDLTFDFRAYLWSKKAIQLLHRLAMGGRLVLFVDATGGLLDFPLVEDVHKKILHTIVAVSPKYSILKDGSFAQDKTVSRYMSPIKLAEMISNKNTGDDYHDMCNAILATEKEIYPGQDTMKPLLMLTDCSAQLQSGALSAFCKDDSMANTRIEYGNRVLFSLLYFESLVGEPSSTSPTRAPRERESNVVSQDLSAATGGVVAVTNVEGVAVSEDARRDHAAAVLASLCCRVPLLLKECKITL